MPESLAIVGRTPFASCSTLARGVRVMRVVHDLSGDPMPNVSFAISSADRPDFRLVHGHGAGHVARCPGIPPRSGIRISLDELPLSAGFNFPGAIFHTRRRRLS